MSFYTSCGPSVRSRAFAESFRAKEREAQQRLVRPSTVAGGGAGMDLSLTRGSSGFGASGSFPRPSTSAAFPNLPGYKSNRVRAHPEHGFRASQSFKTVNGVRVEEADPRHKKLAHTNISKGIAQCHSFGSAVMAGDREPTPRSRNDAPALFNKSSAWLNKAEQVLQFDGHFMEPVLQSRFETFRVRRCCVYYYLVDNTMTIIEHRQLNSGIPQGTVLGRQVLPVGGRGSASTHFSDLRCGAVIDVYGKKLTLTSCNASTREFLTMQGLDAGEAQAPPADAYSTMMDAKAERESKGHGVPQNAMKKYLEATLGNTVQGALAGRGKFLENDRIVLRFQAVWDNRKAQFGEQSQFTLHYFVANDKVEILEVHSANDGRDPFPYLLRAQKLPKTARVDNANGRRDEEPSSNYYQWRDFQIGRVIMVYGRPMQILSMDASTRAWLERAYKTDMPANREMLVEPTPVYRNDPPAWNKFFPGGEEDSLQNCSMLIPKPPPTDFEIGWKRTKGKLEDRVLRFKAKLDSQAYDQKVRDFVVMFYCMDNTVQVREPPVRNSGVIGGKFLLRRKYKNDETGEYFAQGDFFLGKKVKINTYTLVLTDVDASTETYMKARQDIWPE